MTIGKNGWIDATKRTSCPKCRSNDLRIQTKVNVKTLNAHIDLLRCRDCGHRFRSVVIGRRVDTRIPLNLAQEYFNVRSLESLKASMHLSRSKSTIHRWVIKLLDHYPSWDELISDGREKWSHIMGLDITQIKIQGRFYYYIHVVDYPHNHLCYQILNEKSETNIKSILIKIKSAGYTPTVVVTDLAKEIIGAVKEVYPSAVIQGCIFHLIMWLNKRLPTKKIKLTDPDKAEGWEKLKGIIMRVATARNLNEKNKIIEELENLSWDKMDRRAKATISAFRKNIHYYHPFSELIIFGCLEEWRYNNVCERAMRSVKELSAKMYGFKDVELAQKYVNAFWAIRRGQYNKAESQGQTAIQETLPAFFAESDQAIDMEKAAEIFKINVKELSKRLEKAGFVITGSIAFRKDYVEAARKIVYRERPKTLVDLIRITGVDPSAALALSKVLGIRPLWVTLKEVRLIYPQTGHE